MQVLLLFRALNFIRALIFIEGSADERCFEEAVILDAAPLIMRTLATS